MNSGSNFFCGLAILFVLMSAVALLWTLFEPQIRFIYSTLFW